MSPSSACSQLHSRCANSISMSPSSASSTSMRGSAGALSDGPMNTHTMPWRSQVRYEVGCRRCRNDSPSMMFGMSTQRPAASNFHPW